MSAEAGSLDSLREITQQGCPEADSSALPTRSGHMSKESGTIMGGGLVGGAIGASIGGLIGATIWTIIGYSTGYEVGFIAWGLGALVGLGMAVGSGRTAGSSGGVIAVVIALAGIGLGKYAVIYTLVEKQGAALSARGVDPGDLVLQVANSIAEEREASGKKVNWPTQRAADERTQADFPADIWKEANKTWDDLGAERQNEFLAEATSERDKAISAAKATLRAEAFPKSLSPFMILWVVLAGVSAFRLGSAD